MSACVSSQTNTRKLSALSAGGHGQRTCPRTGSRRSRGKVGERGQRRCPHRKGSGLPSWPSPLENASGRKAKKERNKMRQQAGHIVLHRKRWYVRYWERRIQNGALLRKRINHYLGPVNTRGKRV